MLLNNLLTLFFTERLQKKWKTHKNTLNFYIFLLNFFEIFKQQTNIAFMNFGFSETNKHPQLK